MFYVLFNQLKMYTYVHVQCLVRMTAAPCYLATCGELLCCCEQCTCTNHFLYLYITHETVYQALSNWKLLEITGDCWRLLEITGKITGDYRKSLELTGDHWRLLLHTINQFLCIWQGLEYLVYLIILVTVRGSEYLSK